jgi:hypothetical protein
MRLRRPMCGDGFASPAMLLYQYFEALPLAAQPQVAEGPLARKDVAVSAQHRRHSRKSA